MDVEYAIEKVIEIGREANRDGHVGDSVFKDQIPPDDPREDFSQRRVRIGIRAASDGNHGGKLRVAERGETAHECRYKKRKRYARTGALPPNSGNSVTPVQQKVENRRVQN